MADKLIGTYDYTPGAQTLTNSCGNATPPNGMVFVSEIGATTISTNQLSQLVNVTPDVGAPCTPTLEVNGAVSTMIHPLECGVTRLDDDSAAKLDWTTYTLTESTSGDTVIETYVAMIQLTGASGNCSIEAHGPLALVPPMF